MHFLLLLCKLLAHGGWRARRSTSALCLPRPLFLRKAAEDFSFGNEFLILHEMKPNVGRLNACWLYSLGATSLVYGGCVERRRIAATVVYALAK